MKCCAKCFNDTELKAVIEGLDILGECDFCRKKNVHIYDIEKNVIITEYLEGLLDTYTPVRNLKPDFPREKLDLLKNILHSKWNIFNLTPNDIYKLMKVVCCEKYVDQTYLFDEPIGILESADPKYLEENSILKTFNWDDFTEEIKSKNRFHTNYIKKDVLKLFLDYVRKSYKAGEVFYRARISPNENGFKALEMGAPPPEIATAGRANPEGISCLYLSNSVETTFHEIRAGAYDYVSIGRFKLLCDLEVVDLAGLDKISPFLGIDHTLHAVNIEHLKKIGSEIAKPLRRHDRTLDYLPTQYISDYIKSQKFDGIEYKSTLCKGGFNLAIFDGSLFECTDVNIYDIESLSYRSNMIG